MARFYSSLLLLTSMWLISTPGLLAQNQAGLRFVNLSGLAETIDFYLSGVPSPIIRKVPPQTATGIRTEFPPTTYHFQIRATGDSTGPILAEAVVDVQAGHWYSLCYLSDSTTSRLLVLDWDLQKPQLTNVRARFINLGSLEPITVTLRGNPFILNLGYQEVSEFVEVPLLQIETVGMLNASTGELLAQFATPFEGNNVYAVFFVKRGLDWYTIWLNESQQDEQIPLTELQKQTYRLRARLLNFGTDFAVELRQSANSPALLRAASRTASAISPIMLYADSSLQLYRTSNLTQLLAEYSFFTAQPYTDYWFVATPWDNQWQLVPLSFDLFSLPASTLALRLVNLHPNIAAAQMSIVAQNDVLSSDTVQQLGVSQWIFFPQQNFQLLVYNTANGEKIFEANLSAQDLIGPHTLYLTADDQGNPVIYYVDPENGTAAAPFQKLQSSTQMIDAAYRFAQLVPTDVPLQGTANGTPIGGPVAYEQMSGIFSPLPGSPLQVQFQPAGQDTVLYQTAFPVESQRRYLTVLWQGDSLQSLTVQSPAKVGDGQRLFVRFLHCNDQLPGDLQITLPQNKVITVGYRQGSDFIVLDQPSSTLTFTLQSKNNRQWRCQADLEPTNFVYTVIFVAGQSETPAGYLLPEEQESAGPLTPLDVQEVVSKVEESAIPEWVQLERSGKTLVLKVHSPLLRRWSASVFDVMGRQLWHFQGTAPSVVRIPAYRWSSGWYWIVVRDTQGRQWISPIGW